MYPHERSLVKNLSGKSFALIGVNSDRDISTPQNLVKQGKVTWRSFWNGEEGTRGPISEAFQVNGWPTVYLIDANGVVRYENPQRSPEGLKAIDDAIAELLAEIGEEFPAEQIEKDAEAERTRQFASTTSPGGMSAADRRAESRRRAAASTNKKTGENRYGDGG
jgi:hypothetical protein